ncbi:MAG: HAD family hydrolase [Thermoleophilia bacterium]
MCAASAVFIDRDGVINRKMGEGEYVNALDEFEILPGSIDALVRLSKHGFSVIVVTNQQGVGRGLTSPQMLDRIHDELRAKVAAAGGEITAIMVCPHIEGTCDCRKPQVGLFVEAQRLYPEISFSDSFVIGDSASDMEAAARIGAQAIRVSDSPATNGKDETAVWSLAQATELLLGSGVVSNEV